MLKKSSKRGFGKRVFEDPYSSHKSKSRFRSPTKPFEDMLQQSFCTGISVVLALRHDVVNCIPGKRRLLAVIVLYHLHPFTMIYVVVAGGYPL